MEWARLVVEKWEMQWKSGAESTGFAWLIAVVACHACDKHGAFSRSVNGKEVCDFPFI